MLEWDKGKYQPAPVGDPPKGLRWGPYGHITTTGSDKPDTAALQASVAQSYVQHGIEARAFALGDTYWDGQRWVTDIWSWGP